MKQQAIRGAMWTIVDTAGGQALLFLTFMILARILMPEDYGVVTLAGVFIVIPNVLIVDGWADFVVQRQEITDDHLNATFWSNLAIAAGLIVLINAFAGLAADVMQMPLLEPVLRALSIILLLSSLGQVPSAIYRRKLEYFTFALRTGIATVISGLVGIGLALAGFGVWALVISMIAQGVASVIVLWWGIDWRPKLRWSLATLRDIRGFMTRVMAGNVMRVCTQRVDVLIIGTFMDARALGFYYMVTRLFGAVSLVTLEPVNTVMLPVLSRMQTDRPRLAGTYESMVWALSASWVPATAGLGVVAPLLVPLLFGHKWDDAIPLLQIMCLTALTASLRSSTTRALLSVGRAEIYARINFIELCLTAVAFLVAVQFGLIGVGFAVVAISALLVPVHFFVVKRYAGVRPWRILANHLPIVGAAGVMVLGIYLLAFVVHGPGLLPIQIVAGGFVYFVMLYILATEQVNEVLEAVLPNRFRFLLR
jgi:PST family polysaccharide transporter